MKAIHNIVLIGWTIFLLSSCSKETNDFQYKTLNEIKVATIDSSFTIQQLDTLKINTELSQSQPGDNKLIYEWKVYNANTQVNKKDEVLKILSNEKDLNTAIDLVSGDYVLQYTITESATKIKTFRRYDLKVVGAFYEGWLVTNNKDGNAVLSFIRKDEKVFLNPLASINNVKITGKALNAYSAVIRGLKQIVFFTDQEVYRISADDFVINGTTFNLFLNKPNLNNTTYSLTNYNTDQYIITDGGVHATITPNFGTPGKYSDRFFGPEYKAFPYLLYGSVYFAMIYDAKNKRFLQTSYNSRTFEVFTGLPKNPTYDVNNVGKELIAIDRGISGEHSMIMKDDINYYYYSIFPGRSSPAGSMLRMNNCPDIDRLKSITASGTVKQLYYAVDNKVYLYDILANAARLVYEFPTNVLVRDLKIFKSRGWGTFSGPEVNKRLVAATYNGKEGEVYYLELTHTGDILGNTFSKKFGGFGDITQINYRNFNL